MQAMSPESRQLKSKHEIITPKTYTVETIFSAINQFKCHCYRTPLFWRSCLGSFLTNDKH